MANYEVNITTAAWPETLANNMTVNTLGEKTLLPIVSAEEIKSEDSVKPKEDKVEVGRSVRWPGKHLGDNAGSWIGISSPFPTDSLVETVNQRILSPPSGAPTSYYYPPASDISTPSDVSTTEILDLSSLTSFETPTPPFSSPVFPPRLPVSSSHKVFSTLHSIAAFEVPNH